MKTTLSRFFLTGLILLSIHGYASDSFKKWGFGSTNEAAFDNLFKNAGRECRPLKAEINSEIKYRQTITPDPDGPVYGVSATANFVCEEW